MDESVIPKGLYCYDTKTKKICPYHRIIEHLPEQESGYCDFLEIGDAEEGGTLLLWDMCKECGINMDENDGEL